MSILESLMKSKTLRENVMKVEDKDFISTGCLTLNILYSGRLDGGIQVGKVSQIGSPSSLGKSFVGMKIARNAQRKGMDVFYLDTEYAYSETFAQCVGVDSSKILVVQNNRVEEVQQIIVSAIEEIEPKDRKKLLLIIDSWGGLVTSKTYSDAIDGNDVTDMTKSKKANAFATILTGLGVTVFVVNRTYETMSKYTPLAIGGGKGIRYASTAIVMGTSKAKTKSDDGEQDGSVISAVTDKSRLAKEGSKLKFLIEYDGGIHPYWGLMDDLLEGGYVVKPSNGWYSRPCVENDKKWRDAEIWSNAGEFFKPILKDTDFKKYIEQKYSFEHSEIKHYDEDEI